MILGVQSDVGKIERTDHFFKGNFGILFIRYCTLNLPYMRMDKIEIKIRFLF